MRNGFKAVPVADRVWWVGAVDWALRDFHGYSTPRGSTYNAYLVMADKVTLVDTVKRPFFDEMMARVASVVEPSKIDYVISNHAEMDHSGALPEALAAVRPEKLFASAMGAKALPEHFDLPTEITPVKDGQSLSLGNMDVTFLETRMIHWPDSMFTYLADRKLLFSSDGFGLHLASTERFADEIDEAVLEEEASKYFANILLLYAPLIAKLLARVGELGVEIETIAPDHGPIWRENVGWITSRYAKWSEQKPTRKAVVVYDSMWESTARMARAVVEGLAEGGSSTRLLPLKGSHRTDVAAAILDAGALLVGSPTLNNGILPTVADALCYLTGLKPRNKVGAAFGSYGWSGESVKLINEALTAMKVELVDEGVRAKYVPTAEDLTACRALGLKVAGTLAARCEGQGAEK